MSKPTLEALLEEHRERGAQAQSARYRSREGRAICRNNFKAGHATLQEIVTIAVEALRKACWCDACAPDDICDSCQELDKIERALTAGAKGKGK